MNQDRRETVIEAIRQFSNQSDVIATHSLADDLGMDSLDHIELIMAIESELEISIGDDEASKWVKVQDVINTVASL